MAEIAQKICHRHHRKKKQVSTLWVKKDVSLLPTTSPKTDRFSKFFRRPTRRQIYKMSEVSWYLCLMITYYKFTAESAGDIISKISQYL